MQEADIQKTDAVIFNHHVVSHLDGAVDTCLPTSEIETNAENSKSKVK